MFWGSTEEVKNVDVPHIWNNTGQVSTSKRLVFKVSPRKAAKINPHVTIKGLGVMLIVKHRTKRNRKTLRNTCEPETSKQDVFMLLCSLQQWQTHFLSGVNQYSTIKLIRILHIYTEWRSVWYCPQFQLAMREIAGHVSTALQFWRPGKKESKKTWKMVSHKEGKNLNEKWHVVSESLSRMHDPPQNHANTALLSGSSSWMHLHNKKLNTQMQHVESLQISL